MTASVSPMTRTAFLAALEASLPGKVLTDGTAMERYAHDEAEWAAYELPLAVVRATSTEDVRRLVELCVEHRVPVVPRGSGTGLSGGANAFAGSVVLSVEQMDRILRIDPLERIAVVQPGVVNDDLRAATAEHGLWYPPDPASSPWSSIGGNVATNAGGLCCVKYGVTGDYVREIEVVTGTGEVVRLGRRTAKGVAGYDLKSLVVGSEGTLGIITEVTVKLRPSRPEETTIAGYFDSVVDAGRAVAATADAGVVPSAFELVDKRCLKAVDDWKHMGLSTEAEVVLLGRVDSRGDEGKDEAARMAAAFEASGATFVAVSEDAQESEALFAARRLSYPALERLGPALTEDVCVPVAAIPEMLGRIEEISDRHDVLVSNIAHVGDGNLHPLITTPPGDDAARVRAQAAFEEILSAALSLGGTVTGEHGVGLLKRGGLAREQSPAVVAMQQAVKAALDPHGILNPGKAIV
ncbi:FAD-binding oxidoreductase [Nocardioides cheoyonin]|uniref:FAD-binding oxidoreductase n=1 Tax=Nocardioides cheoyonin TaxID=3156615 RepID=UPI0032B5B731